MYKKYFCMMMSLVLMVIAVILVVMAGTPFGEMLTSGIPKEHLVSTKALLEYRQDVADSIWKSPKLYIGFLMALVGVFLCGWRLGFRKNTGILQIN